MAGQAASVVGSLRLVALKASAISAKARRGIRLARNNIGIS